MTYATWSSKLKLICATGILAAVISWLTGWGMFFVWYMIAMVLLTFVVLVWSLLLVLQHFDNSNSQ